MPFNVPFNGDGRNLASHDNFLAFSPEGIHAKVDASCLLVEQRGADGQIQAPIDHEYGRPNPKVIYKYYD